MTFAAPGRFCESLCIALLVTLCGSWCRGADAERVAGGQLQILPREVVASVDYPARFTVLYSYPDGTHVDLSTDPRLQVSLVDAGVASVNEECAVTARTVGTTRLIVEWCGERAEGEIVVDAIAHAVPRFDVEVAAVLSKAGCNLGTCHGNLHGKGGFRLSLRGDNPTFDFESITRGASGRRIDWIDARSSLLLKKPSGQLAHRGGLRLPSDSLAFDRVARWLDAGARWTENRERPPQTSGLEAAPEATRRVESLSVWPAEAWLRPEARQVQLVAVATMADGSRRDVSRWARYETSAVMGVRVSEDGRVHAERPLDVAVSVSYLDARAESRLVFLESGQPASEVASSAGRIDQLVNQRLQQMRIQPLEPAAPEVFLRRLYLAVAGRLPTAAEVRRFLSEPAEGRRDRWIDRAIADPGYADLWALHYSDLLRNEQKVMSPEGARRWNAWLAEQFRADQPLDALVRDLVSTTGSTYDNPPASFHRTHRDPAVAAEALGQVFLGYRIQCARCHNHPFDVWKQDDYYGLAAYFTTIERKQIDNAPRDKLDSHIITGDELISLSGNNPSIRHPGLAADVPPKPLDQPHWDLQGESRNPNPLDALSQWLTRDNEAFARNMANRVWYHVMGRGVVHPPDDFRGSNPPSNPELLDYLTERLVESGFSTQRLVREIVASDTFARASISQELASDSLNGAPVFAGYPLRRMPAEILLDAVSDATGVATRYEPQDGEGPAAYRAVRFSSIPRDGFLRAFGKPDRLLSCECERSGDASLSQSLLLLNGPDVREKIATRPNRIDSIVADATDPQMLVESLYLAVLTRRPTPAESRAMLEHLSAASDERAAAEDILWALINSKEFPWIR